nr:hypothetical protein [Burkholderia diffusa]
MGLQGGLNVYQYAPNPVRWIDPLGLTKCCPCTALALYWPPDLPPVLVRTAVRVRS